MGNNHMPPYRDCYRRMASLRQCRICRESISHSRRGLCDRCYNRARKEGVIAIYPRNVVLDSHTYCRCDEPITQRIPVFNAIQCAKCGRPFEEPEEAG